MYSPKDVEVSSPGVYGSVSEKFHGKIWRLKNTGGVVTTLLLGSSRIKVQNVMNESDARKSFYSFVIFTILRSQPSSVVSSQDRDNYYKTMKHANCIIQLYFICIIFTLGSASEYLHKYVPSCISSRSLFHTENSTQDTGISTRPTNSRNVSRLSMHIII